MMKFLIAIIYSVLSLTAISARSLEGFTCKDYPIGNGEPFTPDRTVRICSVVEQETGQADYLQAREELGNQGRPANSLIQRLYERNAVWPTTQSSNNWQQSVNRQSSPSLLPQVIEAYKQILLAKSNPWTNEFNSPNVLTPKAPLQGQQLDTIVEDVSAVKNSINNLASYLKSLLDVVIAQKSNESKEENININLKLDPSLEALLKQILHSNEQSVLVPNTEKGEEEEHTETESIDDIELRIQEHFGNSASAEMTTENSSDENTTEQQEENSTEDGSTEDDRSPENFEGWFSDHFGPTVNKPNSYEEIEEIFNQKSEQESSTEKSEESFETWFNTVYRRTTTEPAAANSQENTNYSKESNESNSNSGEDNTSNENKDNIEDNTSYDTVFVPATHDQHSNDEYLKNEDRYVYKSINNAKPKHLQWNDCFKMTLSVKNFDDKDMWNVVDRCLKDLSAKAHKATEKSFVDNELKESAEMASDESKSSSETETPTKDSDESNESGAETGSDESKDSNETETPTADYEESKEKSRENSDYLNEDYYGWPNID